MQYSDEYKKALVDRPRENLDPSDWHGRLRLAYFNLTGVTAGGTLANVVRLPAGRVRLVGDLSYMTNDGINDVGWATYKEPGSTGQQIDADPNGIDAAKAATAGNLGSALTTTTKVFNSDGGVDITLTLEAETNTASGWIAYMID